VDYQLKFNFLRSSDLLHELQDLYGFFCARSGNFDSFLLDDVTDDFVTAQTIGVGDDATLAWQMIRTYGSFAQPVYDVKNSPVPIIYIDGVEQMSGYTIGSTGILTFDAEPAEGAVITATFGYYWRVRFMDAQMEFENFLYLIWRQSGLGLRGLKP
jgi:uncharacterized protein (TIGR02217 family)